MIIVGSGAPRRNTIPIRSSPSALIRYQGQFFLVDMGNGTQDRLDELGLIPRQIDGLLLTHHHLDHNEEFGPLLMHSRTDRREARDRSRPANHAEACSLYARLLRRRHRVSPWPPRPHDERFLTTPRCASCKAANTSPWPACR